MKTTIVKRNGGTTETPAGNFGNWVDQLFQENLNRFFNDEFWGFNGFDQRGNLPVNLRETDKTYEMSLAAPGLHKEGFKLDVANDILTISYEHKENKENKEEGWLRREYQMQSFSRSFTLDDTVDLAKISASYDNGILHLTLPKKENAQRITKTIEIK